MKRLLLVMMVFMVGMLTCIAPQEVSANGIKKVAVFLDTPATAISWVEGEDVVHMVKEKSEKLFPKTRFEVLDLETCQMAKKIYKEEHPMTYSAVYTNEDGTQTSVSTAVDANSYAYSTAMMHDVVVPLKISEAVEVGKELGADYILMLRVTNSMPTMSSGFLTVTAKTTVKCDVRVLSVSEEKYIYMKEVTKDGKSTAVYAGAPSFKNAYKEAIEKSLSEVEIDTSRY